MTVAERLTRLEDQMAALMLALDSKSPAAKTAEQAWAERHGMDLADFVPTEVRPLSEVVCSVADAATELGLGEEQVRRLLRQGALQGVSRRGRGRGWLISRASVADLKADRALTQGRSTSA